MKIAFAGDWHGDFQYAVKVLKYAHKQNVDILIHTGDFGIWPDVKNHISMLSLDDFLNKFGIKILFVDGNHEHHPWILEQGISQNGFRILSENIWHIPRGHAWVMEGVKFLGLGGATSVDRQWRTEGFDWFPEERITYSDVLKAISHETVDVMITHDAPDRVNIPHEKIPLSSNIEETVGQDRKDLGEVVDFLSPKHLYHGHFHVRYDAVRETEKSKTLIHGLDMNGTPFDKNLAIVDTDDLVYQKQ